MRKYLRQTLLTVLCMALLATPLFAGKVNKRAKKALERLKMYEIEYNTESFFHYVDKGNFEVVQSFLDAGFDPNTVDKLGYRALIIAAEKNDVRMITTLRKGGADVNLGDTDCTTPLMYAAYYRNKQAIVQLMKEKANVNIQNKAGMTALMFAIIGGDIQCIEAVMTADTDLTLRNTMNLTAVGVARTKEYIEVANYIKNRMDYLQYKHIPEKKELEINIKKGQAPKE